MAATTLSKVGSWQRQRDQAAKSRATSGGSRKGLGPEVFELPFRQWWSSVSPKFLFPRWLLPAVDVFRRAELAMRGEGPPVRAVISTPTQHGKSTLAQHALAYIVGRNPEHSHIYGSYGVGLAKKNSRRSRDLVLRCRLPLDLKGQGEWTTLEGGGVLAVGVDGQITGNPITGLGIIDDPHKSRRAAESPTKRRHAREWYDSDWVSRIHTTTSTICVASRFHVEDLPSYLIEKKGFEYVRLPAVLNDGDIFDDASKLLAPELYTHALLREKALDEYEWWSLYMGLPRKKGESVFGAAATCALADLPRSGRDVIGVDFAYTKKTKNDRTAAVVLREFGGLRFVIEVLQLQVVPEEAVKRLLKLCAKYPRAPMVWHGSSTEVGSAEMMRTLGLAQLKPKLAVGDKFVRAQPAAAAWRSDKIVVPHDASWTTEFLDVIEAFTGVGDANDDAVDGLSSAFDELGPMRDDTAGERRVTPSGQRRTTVGLKRSF